MWSGFDLDVSLPCWGWAKQLSRPEIGQWAACDAAFFHLKPAICSLSCWGECWISRTFLVWQDLRRCKSYCLLHFWWLVSKYMKSEPVLHWWIFQIDSCKAVTAWQQIVLCRAEAVENSGGHFVCISCCRGLGRRKLGHEAVQTQDSQEEFSGCKRQVSDDCYPLAPFLTCLKRSQPQPDHIEEFWSSSGSQEFHISAYRGSCAFVCGGTQEFHLSHLLCCVP